MTETASPSPATIAIGAAASDPSLRASRAISVAAASGVRARSSDGFDGGGVTFGSQETPGQKDNAYAADR